MRMEELSDNRYEKGTDSVERYLLDIVQSYFKNQNVASTKSREYIIKKAVARMQEEVDFESIGVLSITLPSGEKRIGAVSISLADLNGEPVIANKKTAFNVDFGSVANTACEGNDLRLSNKRYPTKHSHQLTEVLGLDAEIAALHGKIDRLTLHNHQNKPVLDIIRYSGSKSVVDLADMEKLKNEVDSILTKVQRISDDFKNSTKAAVDNAKQEIIDAQQKIANMQAEMNAKGQQFRTELLYELETKLNDAYDNIDNKLTGYATRQDVDNLKRTIENAIAFYKISQIYMNDILNGGGSPYKVNDGIPIEIQSLGPGVEPVIDAYIIIKGVKAQLPYFAFDENINALMGSISLSYDGKDAYINYNYDGTMPAELRNASIQVVYSTKGV